VGVVHVLSVAVLVFDGRRFELNSSAFVLILIYSLFRWASGREITIGSVIVLGALLFGLITDSENVSDVVGGIIVMSLSVALGVSIRLRSTVRVQRVDQAKLQEREQLARELHDTVAHHVSGIAIQAQAGRFLASSGSLDGAASALAVIEEEASRTLTEMRAIIGTLRHGEEPEFAPQRGVADLRRLASGPAERPHVHVELSGDLDGLQPSVDAALYRLGQESITNALRHARHATRVNVTVRGDGSCVRLTVGDDGDAASFDPRSASGFGLIGMAERAKLLGGTLEAGPDAHRGWTVQAVLPTGRGGS
jgi:signal transduction histidine kinase